MLLTTKCRRQGMLPYGKYNIIGNKVKWIRINMLSCEDIWKIYLIFLCTFLFLLQNSSGSNDLGGGIGDLLRFNSSQICPVETEYIFSHKKISDLQAKNYFDIELKKPNCTGNIPFDEFKVLQTIYNTMGGESWAWHQFDPHLDKWDFENTNQTNYPNPCTSWQGVICSSNGSYPELINGTFINPMQNCSLYGITLIGFNLTGSVPVDALVELSGLKVLNICVDTICSSSTCPFRFLCTICRTDRPYNSITGTIPVAISNLHDLTFLNCKLFNHFSLLINLMDCFHAFACISFQQLSRRNYSKCHRSALCRICCS